MHVIGTAGHVDHGKSALVRALTGIEPDRLAEEQERGLTIELGYAWTTLPTGDEVGIVDVPGHERFISTMLAGAGQSDVVLFVVDANEGWKPQSEEHLQILTLLGARHAVVALTKVDRCEDVPAARAALEARLGTSVLADAEIVPVSAVSGEGLQALRDALGRAVSAAGEPPDSGRPRVWLDRSFSIKGAGTVVTGTLAGGRLASGDTVQIAPGGAPARIRQIQTHGVVRDVAVPVSRVALNVAGLEADAAARGHAAVEPGRFIVTSVVDVLLRAVAPVTARGAFKAHVGSAEADARLRLIDVEALDPGSEAFARLTLTRALPLQPGDRFVLRDTGRRATVAGGVILDVVPAQRTRGRAAALASRAAALPDDISAVVLRDTGRLTPEELERLSGSSTVPLNAVSAGAHLYDREAFASMLARIEQALREHHAEYPLDPGMTREALARTTSLDHVIVSEIIETADTVATDAVAVRLAAHRADLDTAQQAERASLLAELDAAGMMPPSRADLEATYGAALVAALVRAGDLIVIGSHVWSAPVLERVRATIAETVRAEGASTAARLKEALGTTRKYVIPLLEHLDATGFTRRDGDVRSVR